MGGPEPAPPNNGQPRHKGGDRGKSRRKAVERFAVLNAFVDFTVAELSRGEIAVWLVLYRDTRDGTARTSYDDIARRAGLNRRNVGRALRRLERMGLLQIVHRGGLLRGVSSYRVRDSGRKADLGTRAPLLLGTFPALSWGRGRPLSHKGP